MQREKQINRDLLSGLFLSHVQKRLWLSPSSWQWWNPRGRQVTPLDLSPVASHACFSRKLETETKVRLEPRHSHLRRGRPN